MRTFFSYASGKTGGCFIASKYFMLMLFCAKIRCNDYGWIMNRIAIYLNQHIDGVVYSAPNVLAHYATDRSILKYYPRIMATPANTRDVRKLVKFSNQLANKKIQLPLTVRGGGQSKTGSSIGSGLIISMEGLNHIQEIDTRQRLVRVQAGITLGELRKALMVEGLDLPIMGDTHDTIGGLIAKNTNASFNTYPKTIIDFIQRAEVVLDDGSLVEMAPLSRGAAMRKAKQPNREGQIYQGLLEIIDKHSKVLDQRVSVDHSGYSGLSELRKRHTINPIAAICGSEGTLAIVTEVILRVEPVFDEPDWFAIPCSDAKTFVKICNKLRALQFTDIRVYDTELFNTIATTGKSSGIFRKVNDDGFLIVGNAKDDSRHRRAVKLRKLHKYLGEKHRLVRLDKTNQADFIAIDESLNAYLNDSSSEYHWPLIDGVYVDPKHQVEYLNATMALARELKLRLAIYGSVDFNTFTVRPGVNASSSKGRQTLIAFLRRYIDLIYKCEAYPCGEAPEGRFLAIFMRSHLSVEEQALQAKVKDLFDPKGILNPGIKFDSDARVVLRHFRTEYSEGLNSAK